MSRWMNKQNSLSTYNAVLSSPKKERNLVTCYNKDEPWKYAQWNKPDTTGQIFWFYLSEVPKIGKFIETKVAKRSP